MLLHRFHGAFNSCCIRVPQKLQAKHVPKNFEAQGVAFRGITLVGLQLSQLLRQVLILGFQRCQLTICLTQLQHRSLRSLQGHLMAPSTQRIITAADLFL